MELIHLKDEDAYVSILGRGGEVYGISVYEGELGLNDFKILLIQNELNVKPSFAMYLQNNLTCYWGNRDELSVKQRNIIKDLGDTYRGKNNWLYFMSFKKGYSHILNIKLELNPFLPAIDEAMDSFGRFMQ